MFNMPALQQPFTLLLIQLLIILMATRAAGWVLRRVGQPAVIGEILAGILLGPSVLGAGWSQASKFLFTEPSLKPLGLMSEVGLMLFMFIIGIGLDAEVVRKKARQAITISIASIVLPFGLGLLLSLYLYPRYAASGASFTGFMLFTGIAMSITAFPVLARILRERRAEGSRLGMLALSCAAADDVIAWCVLAAITALLQAGSAAAAGYSIGLAGLYVAFMIGVLKPALSRWLLGQKRMPSSFVPLALAGMIGSSLITQAIGIHALFGAFLAGLVIPVQWIYRAEFVARFEDVAGVLLLPIFFVMTGLRTEVGLLHTAGDWLFCGLIILVAIAGKLGGTALAARLSGESWRDAGALGALMNTRGLMQLIVLNIGYELHMLTPPIFTMMVIMALVTTMMTAPLLGLFKRL